MSETHHLNRVTLVLRIRTTLMIVLVNIITHISDATLKQLRTGFATSTTIAVVAWTANLVICVFFRLSDVYTVHHS